MDQENLDYRSKNVLHNPLWEVVSQATSVTHTSQGRGPFCDILPLLRSYDLVICIFQTEHGKGKL